MWTDVFDSDVMFAAVLPLRLPIKLWTARTRPCSQCANCRSIASALQSEHFLRRVEGGRPKRVRGHRALGVAQCPS